MRVSVWLLGRELVAVQLGAGDPDNGTDPGDATATAMPLGFHAVWEHPSIPALEIET